MLKTVIATALLLWSAALMATLPDSTATAVEKISEPAEKAQFLKEYAFKLYPYNKDVSLEASALGISIAREFELWEKVADGLNTRGIIHGAYREMDSSFICYEEAMKLCEQYGFEQVKMKVSMNTAINHFYEGDYEDAIASYHASLEILEKNGDSLGIAHASGNIGLCHIRLENFDLAIRYLRDALSIYEALEMAMPMARTLNGLGSAFLNVDTDSSIFYLEKGVEVLGIEDSSSISGLMNLNLANAYSYNYDYEWADKLYQQAYRIARKTEDVSGEITILINLGRIQNEQDNFESALEYFSKALPLVRESDELHKELLLIEKMVVAYENLGMYQKALELQHYEIELSDSLFTMESNEHIQDLEAKYEFERKEKEIAFKEMKLARSVAQNRKKTILLITLAGGFTIIVLIALMAFRAYRERERKKQMEAQRKLAEYSRQIELLRANIDIQLHNKTEQMPIAFPKEDINDYLIEPLSEREMEVLLQVAAGKTNKKIAEEIFISVSTVKYHLSNIYVKLDARNRTEALAKANAMSLIVND